MLSSFFSPLSSFKPFFPSFVIHFLKLLILICSKLQQVSQAGGLGSFHLDQVHWWGWGKGGGGGRLGEGRWGTEKFCCWGRQLWGGSLLLLEPDHLLTVLVCLVLLLGGHPCSGGMPEKREQWARKKEGLLLLNLQHLDKQNNPAINQEET